MSRRIANLPATVRQLRRPFSHPRTPAGRSALTEQITTVADDLATLISQAADLRLAVPRPITSAVLDLRAWSARVVDDGTTPPTVVDATGLLAYVRTLPDRQLLALLGDLPWPRLDTLLDAISAPPTTRAASRPPDRPNARPQPPGNMQHEEIPR